MRAPSLSLITAVLLVAAVAVGADARTWTNHEGKQIEAEYVRLDGLKVVLLMNGKEFSVPLANLSEADKQFVFEQQLAGSRPKQASSARERNTDDSDASDDEGEASSRPEPSRRKDNPADGVARIRTWKDNQGNTVRAKFVRIHEQNVILMQGRKAVPCPVANLSAEDQDYLRQFLAARGEEHLMPSVQQLASGQNAYGEGDAGYSPPGGQAGGYSPEPDGYAGSISPPGMDSAPYTGAPAAGNPYSPMPGYAGPSGGGSYAGPSYSPMPGESGYPGYSGDPATIDPPMPESSSYAPYDVASTAGADPYGSAGYPGSSTSSAPGMESGMPSTGYSPNPPDIRGAMPSMTPEGMGSDASSFAAGPTFDSPLGQQLTYHCSNCKGEVPEHINDRCPHCGVRFDYVEEPDGSRKYNGRLWGGGIGGIIAVIIGVVVRLVIMAQRNS